jgi:aldehyde dehydrogenase (NAD+)
MILTSTNPGRDYERIGEVEPSSPQQIQDAVSKARKAQPAWAALSVAERIGHLRSFVAAALERKEDLARMMSLETGRPIATSRGNFDSGIEHIEGYITIAEQALKPEVVHEDEGSKHTLYREPWGVLACISPWNFPFLNVAWQCCQPLLAGNAVVFKNSEEDPLFAQIIEEVVAASTLPAGVFNVLYGDGAVGDQLAHGDVDMILFTGSTRTGQHLMKVAAEKFFNARFDNSGQYCDALKRLIVHESRLEELAAKLVAIAEKTKVGDPFDEATDLGPLVAKRQLELLEAQVADAMHKGATVLAGGTRPEGLAGAYYLPTLLSGVTKDMRVWKEEVFGPVLAMVPFSSEEEAVELANDTDYGLSAYVYTTDKERYRRVASLLKSGLVIGNNANGFSPLTPFGGYKKSGIGRQNGIVGFAEVTQVKVVAEEK